jgi:hypothetical protein
MRTSSTLSLVNTIGMPRFTFEGKFETIPGGWWLGGKELIIRLAKSSWSWSWDWQQLISQVIAVVY